jgi:hypothetical protein
MKKQVHKIMPLDIQKEIEIGDAIRFTDGIYAPINLGEGEVYAVVVESCLLAVGKQPIRLIVLSEDEIKEGNWYHNMLLGNHVYRAQKGHTKSKFENPKVEYKVVAAYPQLEELPVLSKEFVIQWCDNLATEIELDMTTDTSNNLKPMTTYNGRQNEVIASFKDVIDDDEAWSKQILKEAKERAYFILNKEKILEAAAKEAFSRINNYDYDKFEIGFKAGVKWREKMRKF